MSRDAADLVAGLRALSTADRLVDASAVSDLPDLDRCERCGEWASLVLRFDEPCGFQTISFEDHLCAGCARQVIERADTDYVDVEVRIPASVPYFFKQVGGRTPKAGGRELDGRTWDEFPEVAR